MERFWGNDADKACTYANVADQTAKNRWSGWTIHNCNDGYAGTAPVGSFKPNPFGLYDMLGNVWEWCRDVYDEKAYSKHAGNNPEVTSGSGGSSRVYRGGSWGRSPGNVRCAFRSWDRTVLNQAMKGSGASRIADLDLEAMELIVEAISIQKTG